MSLAAVSGSSPKNIAAISSPGPLRVPSENARAGTEFPDSQPRLTGTDQPCWRPHNRLLKLLWGEGSQGLGVEDVRVASGLGGGRAREAERWGLHRRAGSIELRGQNFYACRPSDLDRHVMSSAHEGTKWKPRAGRPHLTRRSAKRGTRFNFGPTHPARCRSRTERVRSW